MMTSTLTSTQRRTLIHIEREKGHSFADVAPAVDLLAEKLAELPASVLEAKFSELARPLRANAYPGRCRDCGNTVGKGEGGLTKSGGQWVTFHIDPCPAKAEGPVVGCSPKQESFIESLAEQRGVEVKPEWLATKATASAAIDQLKAMPKAEKPAEKAQDGYVPEKGDVHVIDGEYFRVHVGQQSGRPYAAIWNGRKFVGAYYDDRAKGALAKMSEATLITAEQAAEFGHMTEECVFCSTAIETPESTAVGYGPHCAAKRGLPWG